LDWLPNLSAEAGVGGICFCGRWNVFTVLGHRV